MKSQFVRIGENITTKGWKRPEYNLIYAWWNSFQKTKYLDQFEIWICGGVLEGVKTMDVDIILTGDFKYPEDLKNILNEGIRLGFDHGLLIDISWQNRLWGFKKNFQPYKKIRSYNKIEKYLDEGDIILEYEGKEIYPGLFHKEWLEKNKTWKKYKKRTKEGKYTLGIQKMSDYIYNNKHALV
jgi:hypothetical protein